MKLWDYSKVPLNINGRVALPISMFWGLGCLVLIKYVQPQVNKFVHDFMNSTHDIGPEIIFIIFVLDVITTLYFTKTTEPEVAKHINTSDKENAAIKDWRWHHLFKNHPEDESRKSARKYLNNNKTSKNSQTRRIANNYPNMKFTK